MRIGFVGAGNVATHLARHLHNRGCEIAAVSARSVRSAHRLAVMVEAVASDCVEQMPTDIDLCLICVNDSSVEEVSKQLPEINGVVAHTSGSVPLDALDKHPRRAVVYPLQTFSKQRQIEFDKVPFFIEASDEDTLRGMELFARQLSDRVYFADSDKRSKLHIAGVLASNFPTFLLEIARKKLSEVNFPLSVIEALTKETVDKVFATSPLEALTGPARRGDIATVEKHLALFDDPMHKEIYDVISRAIIREFND